MNFIDINWQNIFYITSSIAMIAITLVTIWLMYLLFLVIKFIKKLLLRAKDFNRRLNEIEYLVEDTKSKFLNFLLKIMNIESNKI